MPVNVVVECAVDGTCDTYGVTNPACANVDPIAPAPDSPLVSWASTAPEPYDTPPATRGLGWAMA
jgi:hypothetical protein